MNAMDGIIEGFEGSENPLLQTSGSSLGIQQGRYSGNHGLHTRGLRKFKLCIQRNKAQQTAFRSLNL